MFIERGTVAGGARVGFAHGSHKSDTPNQI